MNLTQKYKYPFLSYAPNGIAKSKELKIIVWFHASSISDNKAKIDEGTLEEFEGFKTLVDSKNYIFIMPILSRKHLYDCQILEYSTLYDPDCDEYYKRPDLAVSEIISGIRDELKKLNYIVGEKVISCGISAGANFLNRFSLLYPDLFEKVALISAGSFMFPTVKISKTSITYPLGLDNINISDFHFDLERFKKIEHFIFTGNDDENDGPIIDELGEKDQDFINKQLSIVGKSNIIRSKTFAEYLKNLGVKVQLDIGENEGHEVTNRLMKLVKEFLFS